MTKRSADSIPNPIVLQRADPSVIRHEGEYFFTASHPLYDRIILRRAKSLAELQDAPEVTVWAKHQDGPQSQLIWAPEIHRIGDAWYIYYAAAPNAEGTIDHEGEDETFNHRVFVLECVPEDPLAGPWVERGQVDTGWESFALDATTFVFDGAQYLVWAQQGSDVPGHSNLYIARMANPWTLATPAVMLSRPEYDWECAGFSVNEGPSVLVREGTVYLTYSASATGVEYAMGLLTADAAADLLDPANWHKAAEPVFRSSDRTGQYGPGHNSFTETEDGTPVLVYHARNSPEVVGDPLWDPNRHARAQILTFGSDGQPIWGEPVADSRPTPSTTEVLPPSGLTS